MMCGLIYINSWLLHLQYNKKRINGHFRRQIISFSQKRATKDKNDRDILIQNFTKKMNKDNLVSCDDLSGI